MQFKQAWNSLYSKKNFELLVLVPLPWEFWDYTGATMPIRKYFLMIRESVVSQGKAATCNDKPFAEATVSPEAIEIFTSWHRTGVQGDLGLLTKPLLANQLINLRIHPLSRPNPLPKSHLQIPPTLPHWTQLSNTYMRLGGKMPNTMLFAEIEMLTSGFPSCSHTNSGSII